MDFFDLIKELRKSTPDIRKATKAMKILGWICAFGAVWNVFGYFMMQAQGNPFKLSTVFPYLAFFSLGFASLLFFASARKLQAQETTGKRVGQAGIVVLVSLVIAWGVYLGFMNPVIRGHGFPSGFGTVFGLFAVLVSAQFIVPAWFGIRYLERLPINDGLHAAGGEQDEARRQEIVAQRTAPRGVYKEALFPFGIFGTFALIMAVAMGLMFFALSFIKPEHIPLVFLPVFLALFIGPILYNRTQSSFELQSGRKLIELYTGGGSVFLFNGTWPFFRLLVYNDGIEIRVMLHRFFIPYDRLEEIPEAGGFFSKGILLSSDLPGVPTGIRFAGRNNDEIREVLIKNRGWYLGMQGR